MGIEGFESLEERITPAAAYPAIDISNPPVNTVEEAAPPELDGKMVLSIKDINGDGRRDWFLSEGLTDPDDELFAYVVFGDGSGLLPSVDLTALDGTKGFQIATAHNQIVMSSVTTGDINGDGLNDLIFVANRFDPAFSDPEDPQDFTSQEAVSIVFGNAQGHEGFVNVADADGIASTFIPYFDDVTVKVIGDVNGDGSDELALAYDVRFVFGANVSPTSSEIFFGSSDSTQPFFISSFSVVGLSPLIKGDYISSISVSGAGDFDGDGIDDILVTTFLIEYDTGRSETMVNLIYGNRDGFNPSLYVGEHSTSISALLYKGRLSMGPVGAVQAVNIGDFNGDGRNDIVIAESDPLGTSNLLGHVLLGSDIRGNGGVLPSSSLIRLSGELATGASSAGAVGDFNGDGLDDFVIRTSNDQGEIAYLVLGTTTTHSNIRVDGLEGLGGFGIVDTHGTLWTPAGWGDLNGDGYDDIVMRDLTDTGEAVRYVLYGHADVATPQVTIKDDRTATYVDENGDLVTIKISKGKLTQENFLMRAQGQGMHLELLKLDDSGFAGATVKITATGFGPGDGKVHIGKIFAGDVDLKSVSVEGHLETIVVGDQNAKNHGLGTLKVDSMGGGATESIFHGGSGKIRVSGSVEAAVLHCLEGSFGSIKIGDALVDSIISITRGIRPATEALGIGALSVGANVDSARILTDGGLKVKSVKVGGDWIASDLAVGVLSGDEFFGNDNDYAADGEKRGSILGKIQIGGSLYGTAEQGDSFGICAGEVGKLKIAGQRYEVYRTSPLPSATGDVSLKVLL